MTLFDDVRKCTLTVEMVPAAGIVDFVYPLMGSVLRGIQLGAVRVAGVGNGYIDVDRVPPLSVGEIDALEAFVLKTLPDTEYQVDLLLGAAAWIEASLINDGSPAYQRVMESLAASGRTLGIQRTAMRGAL